MEISAALLGQHKRRLRELNQWFRFIQSRHVSQMQCGQGCALCCHGLFDISIPDAMQVAEGFVELAEEISKGVMERASLIHCSIAERWAELTPPYLLNTFSDDRIDALTEAIGEVGCPFLDRRNSCLIYEWRPMACRLEGLPMVDARDGLFGDWCELNFTNGVDPKAEEDLRLDYYAIQEVDQGPTLFVPSLIYAISRGEWNILVRRI
jgi:Fe-S-cluster containining protein